MRPLPAAIAALLLLLTLPGCRMRERVDAREATASAQAGASVPTQAPGSATTPTPSAATTPTTGASAAPASYGVGVRHETFTDTSRATDATRRGTGQTSGRVLATTIWYPTAGGASAVPVEGAPPARGPFPVVIFSHGLRGTPADYVALLMRWASAGFVVIAPAYPLTNGDASTIVPGDLKNQPADASFVVTSVLSLAAQPGDSFAGLLDADHVAAAGHSEGALTTAGLFTACCRDGRMSAAIVMAGNSVGFGNDFTGSPAAMLFVHGEDDPLVPIGLGHRTWEAVAWPKGFMTLPGQGHIDPYIRPETSAFPAVAAATTDFLRWTLKGDTSALDALRRDGNVTGVARLEDKF